MTQAEKDWLRYRSKKQHKEANKQHQTQAQAQAQGTNETFETSPARIEGLGEGEEPYGQEEGTEDEIGMAFELRVVETILR